MIELIVCFLGIVLVVVVLLYGVPWFVPRAWRWICGHKFWLIPLALIPLTSWASEAVLNIERRGGDVVLFITGGTSNMQYQVWTAPNPDHNVANTNWYYWRHAYSASFHPYAEMLVYGENTSKQPRRFFQIRGIVPDALGRQL